MEHEKRTRFFHPKLCYSVFNAKLTKAVLERCTVEQISKQVKGHRNFELCGAKQALLVMMYALSLENPKLLLQHGVGTAYSDFRMSLVLTTVRPVQQATSKHQNDLSSPSMDLINTPGHDETNNKNVKSARGKSKITFLTNKAHTTSSNSSRATGKNDFSSFQLQ